MELLVEANDDDEVKEEEQHEGEDTANEEQHEGEDTAAAAWVAAAAAARVASGGDSSTAGFPVETDEAYERDEHAEDMDEEEVDGVDGSVDEQEHDDDDQCAQQGKSSEESQSDSEGKMEEADQDSEDEEETVVHRLNRGRAKESNAAAAGSKSVLKPRPSPVIILDDDDTDEDDCPIARMLHDDDTDEDDRPIARMLHDDATDEDDVPIARMLHDDDTDEDDRPIARMLQAKTSVDFLTAPMPMRPRSTPRPKKASTAKPCIATRSSGQEQRQLDSSRPWASDALLALYTAEEGDVRNRNHSEVTKLVWKRVRRLELGSSDSKRQPLIDATNDLLLTVLFEKPILRTDTNAMLVHQITHIALRNLRQKGERMPRASEKFKSVDGSGSGEGGGLKPSGNDVTGDDDVYLPDVPAKNARERHRAETRETQQKDRLDNAQEDRDGHRRGCNGGGRSEPIHFAAVTRNNIKLLFSRLEDLEKLSTADDEIFRRATLHTYIRICISNASSTRREYRLMKIIDVETTADGEFYTYTSANASVPVLKSNKVFVVTHEGATQRHRLSDVSNHSIEARGRPVPRRSSAHLCVSTGKER